MDIIERKVARSRGLVVRAEDSRTLNQEDVGLIPTVYWKDVSVASYYIERFGFDRRSERI